jgi:hypothetical protein
MRAKIRWLALAGPCGPAFDPVDQVMTLWTNKMGLQSGLVGKRSRSLWMSEGPMLLQLDPLDPSLTLRVRLRPSGPAPVGPQGQRVPGPPDMWPYMLVQKATGALE